MNINRRNFLWRGLATAGAAAAATAAAKVGLDTARKDAAAGEPAAPPTPPPSGPTTPAMTADGQVIHVCGHKVSKHSLPVLQHTDEEVRRGVPGRKWVMVIDLARCDGCKTCTAACSKSHHTPSDREWIKVFTMQDGPEREPYFFPKPCFHCDNPPCTRVCPVGATFKRQDGIVLIDNERCIGCRFCMAACPYSTRFFNWGHPKDPPEAWEQPYSPEHGYPRRIGTVEKCDLCPDMAEQGKLPCCASSCPKGTIYFGDQNEDAVTNGAGETVQLSKLLADRGGYRYMEELGTEPRVYYLPKSRHV